MMTLRSHPAHLDPDPTRVISRFFLPGDGLRAENSRVTQIVQRLLVVPEAAIEAAAEGLLHDVGEIHPRGAEMLTNHARAIGSRIGEPASMTPALSLVVGGAFTAEYAVEGAALCNPSAIPHPSQTGLGPGELRVAVSLRCIGEGHLSSVGFAEAVISADGHWSFADRATPLILPEVQAGEWRNEHFSRALEHRGHLTDVVEATLRGLPARFTEPDLEDAIRALPEQLSSRPEGRRSIQAMRDIAGSAYVVEFSSQSPLSARTLIPFASEESHGMEDARFVPFTDAYGATEYRATYTAYDGQSVGSRLITTTDLVRFAIHRLTGSGAQNKGLALFPRLVGGENLALSRTDGENISLARSADGLHWDDAGVIRQPAELWELLQLGNCGSPIETPQGWIVLTHGVGPLRTYSLGAMLLDLEDPTRVLKRTAAPLLHPSGHLGHGYVPRVVYSCGAMAHNGVLWIPVGVSDARVQMFSIGVDELVGTMAPA